MSPLHCVSAWRRKLRSFPCSSSSRRTRFAGLRREQRGIGQNATGDAADGLRLRFAPPRSIGPLSPDPFYEGRSPVLWYLISGAQNLSECLNPRRATGPWVCGKLGQARFHNRACLCRANAPNANLAGGPRASPTRNGRAFLTSVGEGLAPPAKPSPLGEGGWPKARRMRGTVPVIKAARLSRRGGPCGRPRAAGVVGPYGLPYFAGAAHRAARKRNCNR